MTFPKYITDSNFKNLVLSMLNKLNGTRYCKFEQISSHPWFKGFNWNNLISLDMKPAYLPKFENNKNNNNEGEDVKSYIDYIKSLEDWKDKSKKKVTISPEKEKEFNDWFKNF